MTEAEAKKILERLLSVDILVGNEHEAVDMAIKVLEKQMVKKAPIRCFTCTRYTDDDIIDNTCYLCCKGYEDSYVAREENDV